MTCVQSRSDDKIKICAIYGHVNFTLSHASEQSLSRVQQEIERMIACETTSNEFAKNLPYRAVCP